VNNPWYNDIDDVPIEVMLRKELGEVVSPDRLSDIPAAVKRLCADSEDWKIRLKEIRSRWIYNIGTSADVMASHIANAADSHSR